MLDVTLIPTDDFETIDAAEIGAQTPDADDAPDYVGTATYSLCDNKLRLYPFARLDRAVYDRVKAAGFSWAPRQEVFVAGMWTPGREDLLVKLCGDIEEEDITPEERAAQRAERFEAYSDNAGRRAEQVQRAVDSISERFADGQPILVGHHSERKARKDAEKIRTGMRRLVDEMKRTSYWSDRAQDVRDHAAYLQKPAVRARRIKTIEADRRKREREKAELEESLVFWSQSEISRELAIAYCNTARGDRSVRLRDGSECWSAWSALTDDRITVDEVRDQRIPSLRATIAWLERWIQHYDNRLAFERAMLGESGGLISDHYEIKPGGSVLVGGEWLVVVRVNRSGGAINSVTTKAPRHVSWKDTWKFGIESVKGYREPEPMAVEAVKAATKLPPLCNYPAEGYGEATQAEWDRCPKDYKGTKVVEATEEVERHRVREWVRGGRLVRVFLTDAKVKKPGKPKVEAVPSPTLADLPREIDPAVLNRPVRTYEPPAWEKIEEAANNVQVVSAPELFPTPPALAQRMVDEACIEDGHRVLEPSAGTGAILDATPGHVMPRSVVAIEINPTLVTGLRAKCGSYLDVRCADFLEQPPDLLGTFDRVLMNPPFSAEVAHVRHAFGFLKPGGRLVAIMSEGPFFRSYRADVEFRAWLDEIGGTSEPLPADTFRESGTGVNTRLVVIER